MDCDKLFSKVQFFMAQCNRHDEIKDILINEGARHINYLSDRVTHVIADSNCPEADEAIELYDKPVVSSLWVHLCLKAKRLLPAEAFSPFRRIFQNVVAAFSSDLSKTDIDVLAATLTFYGGRLTKDLEHATHFIATSTKPSELKANHNSTHNFIMIAPDWILESVRQKSCLDEPLFEPGLLLDPPPPPPPKQPTPPPIAETEDVSKANSKESAIAASRPSAVPSSNGDSERATNIPIQNQSPSNISPQRFQHHQQQFNPNLQPRMRMVTNAPRTPQQRFRQILPPNSNVPQVRQQLQPQQRPMIADSQQPRKLAIDHNHAYRKVGPYQAGPDIQPMHQHQPMNQHQHPHQHMHQHQQQQQPLQQQQQPIHTYQQGQHSPMHQPGPPLSQPNRVPPPNIYPQSRQPYPSNQMPARINMAQPNMISQQQMQNQPMNRFQDPSNQMGQPRPYQVGVQHQNHNTGYQHSNPQRQPMYYNQNQTMTMRMPQQGPPPRMMIPNEHLSPDNYPQPIETIQPHQQYQPAQQQVYQQPPRHQVASQPQHRPQQFQQPHPPLVMPSRPQFHPNIPGAIRGGRSQLANQEMKPNSRHPVERSPRGPRAPIVQTQPHPSIFDPKQESSYAQMKAKVPILTENIQYFDHSQEFMAPKYQPLTNCVFMLVEHSGINPKLLMKWKDAIVDAGGKFSDDTEKLTHIICESRSTLIYSEAMKKSIRCVTIYWINDVLAEDKMTHPWKALHVPTPFVKDDKPLQNQIISITNFKGRERREVKEMITKTGAKCTEYFSQANTLLICGSPGGEKYERAIEWSIPIANCQLLSDFLISGRDFSQMLAHAKYQNFNRGDQLRLDSYVLIRDLMQPWTKPVPMPVTNTTNTNGTSKDDLVMNANEDSGLATGGSTNSDIDAVKTKLDGPKVLDGISEDQMKAEETEKQVQSTSAEQTEQQSQDDSKDISSNIDLKAPVEDIDVDMKFVDAIDKESKAIDTAEVPSSNVGTTEPETTNELIATKSLDENIEDTADKTSNEPVKIAPRTSNEPVRILFTHLEPERLKQLEGQASKLGLALAGNPIECTHLVVNQISRTPKFICAFSHAKHILSYNWLIESYEAGQVLDEKAFILQDSEGEKKFSFNLVYSLVKRRRRKGLLFTNFIFFVTPAVLASVKNLKEMIESAGGKITTRKLPTLAQLNQIRAGGKRFAVITNQQDLHLCSDAEQIGADLLRAEFVISGILRQDIDIDAHRISLRQPVKNSIAAPANRSVVEPSPNKRLRFE